MSPRVSPRGARNFSLVAETIDLPDLAPILCQQRKSRVNGILMSCLEAASKDFCYLPPPPAASRIAHLSLT